MSKKNSIYDFLHFKTLSDGLNKSDMAFFRKVCRWYSTNFHTPLHIVMECKEVQWDEILLHYYEDQIEEIPFNSLYDIACQEYIPEFAEQFEEENQAFADALVEEQRRDLERKKRREGKKEKLAPATTNKKVEKSKAEPKSINLNFEEEEY